MRERPAEILKEYKYNSKGNQKLSRYKNLRRYIDADGYNFIETPDKVVIRESTLDRMFIVDPGCENRLDLVSYKFYGTPFLWWVLAKINNIQNPMYLPTGVILRIPPLNNIVL